MIRWSVIIWIMFLAGSSFVIYSVKFKVQTLQAQIAEIERDIETERETANVVAAEWAYLTRPERLRKLSANYLGSRDTSIRQVADVKAIPHYTEMPPATIMRAALPAMNNQIHDKAKITDNKLISNLLLTNNQ